MESRTDIETWSIDRVLNKGYYIEKVCRNCVLKISSTPLFNFGK